MAVKKAAINSSNIFRDEAGFSTVGMVFALLITLSLIFSAAHVYQVNSIAADVQSVADTAALAAANEVAEFHIVVRFFDAVSLSLSLAGIAAAGLGIVSLCTPATAPLSEPLIKASHDIVKARNSFIERAVEGLNRYQQLLPFLGAVRAYTTIRGNTNARTGMEYVGFATLIPCEGKRITAGSCDKTDQLLDGVEDKKDDLDNAARQADEAAREARIEKEQAFLHDCGFEPNYCMYERASHLAGLSGSVNPLYRSSDAWSFSVALKRAQAYYPERLRRESPAGVSTEEQAQSALRKNFYHYAGKEVEKGYVTEDEQGGFSANFPLLPKNTEEMKLTALYTESVYPITTDATGANSMHAWDGCPTALSQGVVSTGSLASMDAGGYTECSDCRLSLSSMGKVAAASSSIDNGFEFHYRKVAEAAQRYQEARDQALPYMQEAQSIIDDLFGHVTEALSQAASARIDASPPGRIGVISFAASTKSLKASEGFSNTFVSEGATLGTTAAISGATLVSENSEEGKTIISSMLDGVRERAGMDNAGPFGMVLELWSCALSAYSEGGDILTKGIDELLSSLPLVSESGLGTWASGKISEAFEVIGLQPVKLDAPKPALVNTVHILAADGSEVSSGLLKAKEACITSTTVAGSGGMSVILSSFESEAYTQAHDIAGDFVIATIEPFGDEGPSFPVSIALPFAKSLADDTISGVFGYLQGIVADVSEGRTWW